MRTILAIFVVVALLIAGCSQNQAGTGPQVPAKPAQNQATVQNPAPQNTQNNTPGPAVPSPGPNCTTYCKAMEPCAGTPAFTGTYPDCVCACSMPPAPSTDENETNDTGELPAPSPINMSVSEMLDLGISNIKNDFYRANSGTFTEKTYKWARVPVATDMSEITFDTYPYADVKFNNQSSKEILASGFVVFIGEGKDIAYGVSVFKGKYTLLDTLNGFSVDYFPASIDKSLGDCVIFGRDYYTTANGDWFIAYSYNCNDVFDK